MCARQGTPRPGNGGARVGAGRKPTTKPLKNIELHINTANKLAALTVLWRKRLGDDELSQAKVVAELIADEYRNMGLSTASPQVGGEN